MTTLTLVLTILSFVLPTVFTLVVVLDSYYSQYMDWAESNINTDLDTAPEWYADCVDDMRELETNTTHDEPTSCHCTGMDRCNVCVDSYIHATQPCCGKAWAACDCEADVEADAKQDGEWDFDLPTTRTCILTECTNEVRGTVYVCKSCAKKTADLLDALPADYDFYDDVPF